jgi:hypothetical protein
MQKEKEDHTYTLDGVTISSKTLAVLDEMQNIINPHDAAQRVASSGLRLAAIESSEDAIYDRLFYNDLHLLHELYEALSCQKGVTT